MGVQLKTWSVVLALLMSLGSVSAPAEDPANCRRITIEAYRDKMAAGWVGQMVGVGWGAPTEFRHCGVVVPKDQVPVWTPETVNQFGQDDLYVEMTFLRTLELHGLDASIRQAGIDFANSGYRLWHANKAGRENLRSGIAPPDSGHPAFNKHADDIDYQIEADFAGLIAPGMPNIGIRLGEVFGRLMNYGDGLYGGQFVAGMYAEAFFETDPRRLVEAGLACIPVDSQYAEAIRDVLLWYEAAPDDWESTWRRIDEKYQRSPAYRRFSCQSKTAFNIDAKINGAYIAMGLLYGERDIEKTTVIAMRCGQDSDCNPSNAAGVLFTSMGLGGVPATYTSALDHGTKFSHTEYDFDALLDVCERLARQAVLQNGGRIEKNNADGEVFVIPVRSPQVTPLEQSWEPGPAAGSRFTEAEMEHIPSSREAFMAAFAKDVAAFAPGWRVRDCGEDMDPGIRAQWGNREGVLVTHPLNETAPCVLYRTLDVLPGKQTVLRLAVGHHELGDWDLVVRADDRELLRTSVGPKTVQNGWLEESVDLGEYAGQTIALEVRNVATGWSYEAGYWDTIEITSR